VTVVEDLAGRRAVADGKPPVAAGQQREASEVDRRLDLSSAAGRPVGAERAPERRAELAEVRELLSSRAARRPQQDDDDGER
jgi:hypothetical protein